MKLVAGSRAAELYGVGEVVEPYFCNYGVDRRYASLLEDAGLRVSGVANDGEVRIVELPEHPFFVATLFVFQAGSPSHPLVRGFVDACRKKEHEWSRKQG